MRPTVPISLLTGLLSSCTLSGTVGVVGSETETTAGTGSDDARPGSDGPLPDVADGDAACVDRGDSMGVGPCSQFAPPDSFEATLQWSWTGPDGDTDTLVIPLVANLTDDDGNGRIDLCDSPDVVVVAGPPASLPLTEIPPGRLYALDGASGALHWVSDRRIRASVTPALGDIDGDGSVEIVALAPDGAEDRAPDHPSRVVVFEADGQVAWLGDTAFDSTPADAVALADLDGDGDAEIMVADRVFDHEGRELFVAPDVGVDGGQPLMPFAVDLDGDDDMEVLWGRAAHHHDGTPLFSGTGLRQGYAHVANFDDDPEPEIVVTTDAGLALLDADGSPRVVDVQPPELGMLGPNPAWRRPAAIHDIDGDRRPELLMSVGIVLVAFSLDVPGDGIDLLWTADVFDGNGSATGTAFDFLGDTTAEAIYADERALMAFDELGVPVLTTDRTSFTLHEYPVVADVDNDGSAELVVGSNAGGSETPTPTLMVLGEASNRWVQARRIWNQHTYHVTNIGEDGQIPAVEPKHWLRTNTFRTNAQLEGGVICVPVP